ncbi:DALR anticodon-binding domain-containing protein [Nocardia sp. NPDC020380]|uniref:DALR anticodon-binding domain-containing protein n=1 Tax=Nocardia sp. NPDC020380 TaxID=3364309 RepID=UPI0037B85359
MESGEVTGPDGTPFKTRTGFYDACPVLAAPDAIRENRIALCSLAVRTLAHGLGLLGIAAPERL